MGLTIHYSAKDPKAFIKPETALACVDFVKDIAERNEWAILGEWNEVVDPSQYEKSGSWDEATNRFITPPRSKRTHSHHVGISVHPHPDSESVVISFDLNSGKLAHYVEYGESKYVYNAQFCKTHYAGFPTHRKVCRLLQAIDKHFVPLEVYDEGGYYGVWDDKKGKENFGEYVAFVHGMGQMLNEALGGGANVVVHSSEDVTDGWKEEYIDHLAKKYKEGENAQDNTKHKANGATKDEATKSKLQKDSTNSSDRVSRRRPNASNSKSGRRSV